jgi:hypothetical integral membrane protein (TIGR02206 family)
MGTLKYFFYYDADLPSGLSVRNFSSTHLSWLFLVMVFMALFSIYYRRLDEIRRRKVMKALAITILLLEVARAIWAISIGHYELDRMLPLHLCGLMIFVELMAVFTKKRIFKELAYCLGLPGSFMALVTPEPSGYPLLSFQYLQSIVIHTLIALVPFLWVFADGFRPNIRYLPACFMWLCSFTAVAAGVNLILGSNYMFICQAPGQTPIELFDRWVGHPGYVGLLLLTVIVVWTLMVLPWEFARRKKAHEEHGIKVSG